MAGVKFKIIITNLILLLLIGCEMNNPVVLKMEAAYKLPSSSSTEANKNVSDVINLQFPKGMNVLDAMHILSQNGFSIIENKSEGFRKWPSNEKLKPYAVREVGESIRKNYTKNQINYHATFSYWSTALEKSQFTILIESHDGVITKSSGAIYIHTL